MAGIARATLAAALLMTACGRREPPPPAPPAVASSSPHGDPCGPLECAQYDSAADAFRVAVAGDAVVLGIGEAHAQKGATAPSSAARFTHDLLPLLQGRASDLLVELMMPPGGCADATAEVHEKQAAATSRQAETNQNEYVAMGERARALGIVPDMLRPTCSDLEGVRRAGDDAITASLELIARLSVTQGARLVDRDARSDADRGKTVVLYGGMLHNDLAPKPEAARWSYAPELARHARQAGGRLVAVDLVVPEFIGDDETWRALPWWQDYDRARLARRATLFRTGETSYVLVFPETPPKSQPGDAGG